MVNYFRKGLNGKAKEKENANEIEEKYDFEFGNIKYCYVFFPFVEKTVPLILSHRTLSDFIGLHCYEVTDSLDSKTVFVWYVLSIASYISVMIDVLMVLIYGKWQLMNLFVPIVGAILVGVGIAKYDIELYKRKRRRDITFHLPTFMTRFSMYLYAGYGVSNAWNQALLLKTTSIMIETMRSTRDGMMGSKSEVMIYYELGQKLKDQRIDRLLGLIQNANAFGDKELFIRLDQFKQELAHEKLREARVMGEEAKVKLVIPLFVNLSGILTLIMVPIFITLRGILK